MIKLMMPDDPIMVRLVKDLGMDTRQLVEFELTMNRGSFVEIRSREFVPATKKDAESSITKKD